MTLNYNWQNVASWTVQKGQATVTFWVDAKLSSQSTTGNYSVIDTRLNSTIVNNLAGSGYNFQLSGSTGKSGTGVWYFANENILTGQFRYNHNENGTATGVNIHAWVSNTYWSFGQSIDAYVDLPTINRYAVTNSVTGSDIESNFTVNYTKYVDSYTYKLRISIPNVRELERITYNTSGTSFTLSQETITDLFNTYSTANTFNLGFAIETWNENTKLSNGNEKIISCQITNANPTFSDFDYEDGATATTALTGDSSKFIRGYSQAIVEISSSNKAVAQKGATMVKYRIIIGDQTVDLPYSDSTTFTAINNVTSGTISVSAIDSRNNATTIVKNATILDYRNVFLDSSNVSFIRNTSNVSTATLTFNGTFWAGDFSNNNTNTITSITYRLKKTDSDTWITGTTTITPTVDTGNGTYSFTGLIASDNQDTTWDLNATYNLELTVTDKLSNVVINTIILDSAIPTLCLDKKGVGIMCAYDEEKGGLLQVGGKPVATTDIYEQGTTLTNKTFKGKPVYRNIYKKISGTVTGGDGWTMGPSDCTQVVKLDVIYYDSTNDQWSSFPYVANDGKVLGCDFRVVGSSYGKFVFKGNATLTFSSTDYGWFILEYTKD